MRKWFRSALNNNRFFVSHIQCAVGLGKKTRERAGDPPFFKYVGTYYRDITERAEYRYSAT